MAKKRILMVSYRFPWPEYEGGYNLRVLNLAKILEKKYQIDLLTLFEKQSQFEQGKNLKSIFGNVFLIKKTKLSEGADTFKTFFSNSPLQVGYYSSEKMRAWVFENYKKYDLLFLCTLRSIKYIPPVEIPKVIDLIDSITLNYKEAKEWNNLFWRAIYKTEIPRLKKHETKILKSGKFSKIFISSQFDKDYLLKQAGGGEGQAEKLTVVPNGVNPVLLERRDNQETIIEREENWISFLGKMDTQPNQDAAVFFAREVFLKIIKSGRVKNSRSLKFYIIGPNPTKKVKNLKKIKGVEVTGYLENPYQILKKSKIIVAPLRFGAGIQNKVLEAMALGKATVTSEIGKRGIKKAKSGTHFEVVDIQNSGLWAEKIIELILNSKRRKEIGESAEKLIRENYRWGGIGEKLLEEIEQAFKAN